MRRAGKYLTSVIGNLAKCFRTSSSVNLDGRPRTKMREDSVDSIAMLCELWPARGMVTQFLMWMKDGRGQKNLSGGTKRASDAARTACCHRACLTFDKSPLGPAVRQQHSTRPNDLLLLTDAHTCNCFHSVHPSTHVNFGIPTLAMSAEKDAANKQEGMAGGCP
jgi:hypothetical protein